MIGKQSILFGAVLVIMMFIFVTPVSAESEGKGMYIVETDQVDMKTAPATDAETVGILVRGDKLTIFDQKNGYVKTFYSGKRVWVASQHIAPVKKETPKNTKTPETNETESPKPDKESKSADTSNKELKVAEAPELKSATIEVSSVGPLSGHHIVIDAGHGGNDSGAVAEGVNEKSLTLSTALLAAEELQRQGATVTLTRTNDRFLSLEERVTISHSKSADIFISFHYNAYRDPSVGGINTFYYGNEELQLATIVQDSLISHVKLDNRGAKTGNFHVIRENNDLALLVELGFMTNPEELDTIKTDKYQEEVAAAIADGLIDYYKQ
ncbi:N-acetylmuramoyl-L-alanine amidase [Virgibacillus kekensis]|uniref:N-acetylmuramoyl-L-alanine amidase n=1 Tax=Virgibacillus kekensis TaxID=202261 RepID=A0ABV9DHT8_9BACI